MVAEVLSILLHKALNLGLFEGLQLGNTVLSHLQYADDTIIFCQAGEDHLLNVKRVLRCFQLISGLKINFTKSSVIGVKVAPEDIQNWAASIHCKVGTFPCSYLGLPLGAKVKSWSAWKMVVDKFRQKLVAWKAKLLSFGGGIILLKSVMSSLPLYFMSLLPIPSTVNEELEKIMRRFLWSGASVGRKLHLVDWENVCNLKEGGGLGIFQLKLRNRALLNKWLWRFSNERGCLWRDIVAFKQGIPNNSLVPIRGNSRMGSAWWKSITLPLEKGDDMGNFIADGMLVAIGNGRNVDFWTDQWVDGMSLKEAFPRVFALALKKEGKACEFG